MGKYWCFFRDAEKEQRCECEQCNRKGYVGNYKFWACLDDTDYPVDFEEEKRDFLEWCENNEADEMDYFALYMICSHDGMYGGLIWNQN